MIIDELKNYLNLSDEQLYKIGNVLFMIMCSSILGNSKVINMSCTGKDMQDFVKNFINKLNNPPATTEFLEMELIKFKEYCNNDN